MGNERRAIGKRKRARAVMIQRRMVNYLRLLLRGNEVGIGVEGVGGRGASGLKYIYIYIYIYSLTHTYCISFSPSLGKLSLDVVSCMYVWYDTSTPGDLHPQSSSCREWRIQ